MILLIFVLFKADTMITNLIIRVSKQKQKRKTLKTPEVQNQAIRKICYVLCNFEAIKRRHGCFVPSTNSLSLEIIYILFYNYLMEWKYKYGTLTIEKEKSPERNEFTKFLLTKLSFIQCSSVFKFCVCIFFYWCNVKQFFTLVILFKLETTRNNWT